MEKEIAKQAEALYRDVLTEFRNRKEWDNRSLSMMLYDRLSAYNDEIKALLEPAIYGILHKSFGRTLPNTVPTVKELSAMLYRNAKDTAQRVTALLRDAATGRRTLTEIASMIYDGYGYMDRDLADIKKKLPQYINDYMRHPINQRAFERDIARIRTRPLRIAYRQIGEAVSRHDEKAIKTALKTALEEKARYYANRIAQTEQQRAISLSRAKQYLEDDDIELVKYRMSSNHPMVDICDYYANLDVGYGKGIVPKEQMIALPLHPHCRCRYDPYYKRSNKRDVIDHEAETLKQFSEWEQTRILGGYDAVRRWKSGESVEDIFSAARPKYKIVTVVDIVKGSNT